MAISEKNQAKDRQIMDILKTEGREMRFREILKLLRKKYGMKYVKGKQGTQQYKIYYRRLDYLMEKSFVKCREVQGDKNSERFFRLPTADGEDLLGVEAVAKSIEIMRADCPNCKGVDKKPRSVSICFQEEIEGDFGLCAHCETKFKLSTGKEIRQRVNFGKGF